MGTGGQPVWEITGRSGDDCHVVDDCKQGNEEDIRPETLEVVFNRGLPKAMSDVPD